MAEVRNQPSTHMTDLELQFRVETSAPSNPEAGDMYVDTATMNLAYYTGTAWVGTPLS